MTPPEGTYLKGPQIQTWSPVGEKQRETGGRQRARPGEDGGSLARCGHQPRIAGPGLELHEAGRTPSWGPWMGCWPPERMSLCRFQPPVCAPEWGPPQEAGPDAGLRAPASGGRREEAGRGGSPPGELRCRVLPPGAQSGGGAAYCGPPGTDLSQACGRQLPRPPQSLS